MMNTIEEPQAYEQSFGVIVFRENSKRGEVLLARYKNSPNHWAYPKGHAEFGEDGLSAAIREVKEETDIDARVADASIFFTESYEIRREGRTTKKTVTYFVGEGEGNPRPQASEIIETRWASIQEAQELLTYQSARDILRNFLSKE